MWNFIIRIAIGLLLIIHGVAHYSIATGWGSRPSAESWLLGSSGLATGTIHSIGNVLSAMTVITFMASGAMLLFNIDWWRPLAVAASILSLGTVALFWQPNMILGVVIDLAIIFALLWPNSPVVQFITR